MKVEQLEKCVRDTVLKINTPEMLREFLLFCSNGNIYQMNIENIMATYYQKPDDARDFHCKIQESQFSRMKPWVFRQGFQITSLISTTLKEEIYGFGA